MVIRDTEFQHNCENLCFLRVFVDYSLAVAKMNFLQLNIDALERNPYWKNKIKEKILDIIDLMHFCPKQNDMYKLIFCQKQ